MCQTSALYVRDENSKAAFKLAMKSRHFPGTSPASPLEKFPQNYLSEPKWEYNRKTMSYILYAVTNVLFIMTNDIGHYWSLFHYIKSLTFKNICLGFNRSHTTAQHWIIVLIFFAFGFSPLFKKSNVRCVWDIPHSLSLCFSFPLFRPCSQALHVLMYLCRCIVPSLVPSCCESSTAWLIN